MWKKLFYDASKRFANDVSNIVGNEMKKQTKKKVIQENSDDNTRAIYLNQLRYFLNEHKDVIQQSCRILENFAAAIGVGIESDEIIEYETLLEDLQDIREQRKNELDNLTELGERLGELTNDYTVMFRSADVEVINRNIWLLLTDIINIPGFLDSMFVEIADEEELKREITKCSVAMESLKQEVDNLYNEITRINRVIILDDRGKRIIDYND